MPPLNIPHNLSISVEAHKKWLTLLTRAQELVENDVDLQVKSAKGLRLKERNLPAEVLGLNYAQYCDVINKMYDAYLNNVHLQRAPYMLEIISVLLKRMYELRNEIVHLIVNDYIYVDSGLMQSRLTPPQIQIVIPYHFPLESRNESTEQLLQKMWADSYKRRNAPPKKEKTAKAAAKSGLFSDTDIQEDSEPSDEEEEEVEPSVHTLINEEFINASLIQAHERYRQWYMVDYRAKCNSRKTYFADKVQEAPLKMKIKAATLIQKIYREFIKIKRQRVVDSRRDMMIGLIPDHWADRLNFEEENNKLYERRRQTRTNLQQIFLKELEKEKVRLLVFKKENQKDDITEQIREWFREWYYGYGFFPEFPYDVEGGTLMVIRGDYPTIEEKKDADEKYLAATKGKTKDMLKQEKKQAKMDAQMRAETLKEAAKKEAEILLKLRCNPLSDPGYEVKTSAVMGRVVEAFRNYRTAWSIYDRYPPDKCADIVYGYMQQILTEDLMCQIHKDARIYVDELMRLDLQLLIKSQQLMYKKVGWKFPKMKARPKPGKPPVPKPLTVDHALLKEFEVIFDLGIISKPTDKMKDVYGDSNYAAYELNIRDPDATFPPPGYGDIKNRLILSCIYGIGMDPGAPKNKAVMLMGPPRNGKSFLVDVVAGELSKLHISPLSPTEFMEPLVESGIEPVTKEDYQEYVDFFIENSSLKKEREEYELINNYRAVVYKKLAQEKNKQSN